MTVLPSTVTPYDLRHAKWKKNHENQNNPYKRRGFYDRYAPLTEWDKQKRRKQIEAQIIRKKANQRRYRKRRKQYRRIKVRMVDGRRTVVTYNLKAIPNILCFQNIHLSEYASQKALLDLLCRLRKRQILSASPHIVKKWFLRNWFKSLSDEFKVLVHIRSLTRKFWTENILDYVRRQVVGRIPLNEICAGIYYLYYHKIRTVTLAKMAYRFGWVKPTYPPWY